MRTRDTYRVPGRPADPTGLVSVGEVRKPIERGGEADG
jgi:hypothetical protein